MSPFRQDEKKKTILSFLNRKYAKKALINRTKLHNIDKASLGLSNNAFISENITPRNSKISYHYRRLKRSDKIEKRYTRDGVVHITDENINHGKPVKIYYLDKLTELFPEFDFKEDAKEEDPNASIQSRY